MLVDADLNICSVIDWEFCYAAYAAPAEFFHCSPWWLLLTRPETWDPDLDDFLVQYIPRQKIFLDVLQDRENELIQSGATLESLRLSEHMAQSLDNGNFWFYLTVTYSFAFDDIYWRFIHPKYYGPFGSVEGLSKVVEHKGTGQHGDIC